MTVAEQWNEALRGLVLRHPNPSARPLLFVEDAVVDPVLFLSISNHRDTGAANSPAWDSFTISNVRLACFPGAALARMWVAAAWAGYIQHEALELVTVDGVPPLNPHDEPYETNPCNRGLRDGLPSVLTRESMLEAFTVVMSREHAARLMEDQWPK
jgi:hypothetical protein